MKSFITQTILVSSLTLSMAYARDRGRGPEMDAATIAAFEACASEVGMPDRESGERPGKEQHEAMKTCLKDKGITPPERLGGPRPDFKNDDASEE